MAKQGNIRISSENMMPIIKKWLYSDKDIFLREIVANGVDAITKFKKLLCGFVKIRALLKSFCGKQRFKLVNTLIIDNLYNFI